MKLSIIIPAFNEEKTIGSVIEEIPKSLDGIDETEIIVINDGSIDGTETIAKAKGAKVYTFTKNKGLGKAIAYGFKKAIENDSDIMVILDADNQYDSKEVPLILKPIIQNKVQGKRNYKS